MIKCDLLHLGGPKYVNINTCIYYR